MDIDPKMARIWELAEPVALEAGLELVDVEHRREGHGTVLRLFIDRRRDPAAVDAATSASHAAPASAGVSIDELTDISRQISDLLDVHVDAVPGVYTLEVSSPGINRPLTRPAHFPAFVGKRVHVRTRVPVDERNAFRGTLEAVDDDGIVVAVPGSGRHTVPFSAIARANYQHEFPTTDRKGSAPARAGRVPRPGASRKSRK
jgi:ribosome maturation factor RimP